MAVTMAVFEPKVQCRGNFPSPESCQDVLADMPATTEVEVFGPADARFVKEVLPQYMVSGKKRSWLNLAPALAQADDDDCEGDDGCQLKLFSTGRADFLAWYQIWEAVVRTFWSCYHQSCSRETESQDNMGEANPPFARRIFRPQVLASREPR